jgi:hypothetical protein
MSTGGPDPNRDPPPNPEVARGNIGNEGAGRFGMPSMLVGILVVAITVAFIVYVLVVRMRTR